MINDKDEWGNISVPGITDQELYTKDWNKIGAIKQYYKNNPDASQQISDRIKNRHKKETIDQKKNRIEKTKNTSGWQQNNSLLKEKQKKPLITPSGIFESIMSASQYYNVDVSTIKNYIKNNPIQWKYLHSSDIPKGKKQSTEVIDNRIKKNQKKIMTPMGLFDSRKDAAEGNNVSLVTVSTKVKKYPDQWYYIKSQENKD